MWKCPKCSYRSTSHQAVMRHYYKNHHTSTAKSSVNKGKEKKIHIFKPLKRKR